MSVRALAPQSLDQAMLIITAVRYFDKLLAPSDRKLIVGDCVKASHHSAKGVLFSRVSRCPPALRRLFLSLSRVADWTLLNNNGTISVSTMPRPA